jgi:hypothetical protein
MRKRKMRYICAMLFMICCISDMRVNAQEDKIYYVRQDGTGDFTSIQDGVNQVEDGAVLIITPGVYNESVTVTDKTIRLIGTNREKCIIMASAENYHNIPLTIGAGMVSNLTIYGRNLSGEYIQPVSLNENTVYEWQDTFPGYAIHIDQDYSYGRELIIDNCKVISDSNQCIGIGCRGKSTIQISNSELIANGQGGCIYLHNNSNPELDGDAQFIMKNCRLTNYKCPYIMALHSMGKSNSLYLTFENVKASTVAYEDMTCYNTWNANTWFDVRALQSYAVKQYLQENGYYSAAAGQLLHTYSVAQRRQLSASLQNNSLLKERPELEEGITILQSDTIGRRTGSSSTACQVIDIANAEHDEQADGWCGLSGIYLTQESKNNTLIEMNYPLF